MFESYRSPEHEALALLYVSKAKEQLETMAFSSEKNVEATVGDMLKRCNKSLNAIAAARLANNEFESAISILRTVQDAESNVRLGEIFASRGQKETDPKKASQLLIQVPCLVKSFLASRDLIFGSRPVPTS